MARVNSEMHKRMHKISEMNAMHIRGWNGGLVWVDERCSFTLIFDYHHRHRHHHCSLDSLESRPTIRRKRTKKNEIQHFSPLFSATMSWRCHRHCHPSVSRNREILEVPSQHVWYERRLFWIGVDATRVSTCMPCSCDDEQFFCHKQRFVVKISPHSSSMFGSLSCTYTLLLSIRRKFPAFPSTLLKKRSRVFLRRVAEQEKKESSLGEKSSPSLDSFFSIHWSFSTNPNPKSHTRNARNVR